MKLVNNVKIVKIMKPGLNKISHENRDICENPYTVTWMMRD